MNGPKLDQARRNSYGTTFGTQAALYDYVRPGYPSAVLSELAELARTCPVPGQEPEEPAVVCDLGAGTGKLGGALADCLDAHHGPAHDERPSQVIAVDPDAELLAHNPCASYVGRAEAIPLENATISLVTVGQAWHWLEPRAATTEIARVLRPGGHVAILNNQLDVRIGWVHRLSRIMHAGDVYRPQWRPDLGPAFTAATPHVMAFSQPVTVETVVRLAQTRTYWLRAGDSVRNRVESNIRQYLGGEAWDEDDFRTAHMGSADTFALPYVCLLYTASLRD